MLAWPSSVSAENMLVLNVARCLLGELRYEDVSVTCGKRVPVLTFLWAQLPEGKTWLRTRVKSPQWCLRQSLTYRNRALGVRGEVENHNVGILGAFATAGDL